MCNGGCSPLQIHEMPKILGFCKSQVHGSSGAGSWIDGALFVCRYDESMNTVVKQECLRYNKPLGSPVQGEGQWDLGMVVMEHPSCLVQSLSLPLCFRVSPIPTWHDDLWPSTNNMFFFKQKPPSRTECGFPPWYGLPRLKRVVGYLIDNSGLRVIPF